MEDYTNPFSEYWQESTEDGERQSIDEEFVEIDIDHEDADETSELTPKVSADAIAEYLLKKKLVLTALEFHMELLETGRELPRLRSFFSNPGNFLQQGTAIGASNTLYRSSSIATFDSLELTHSDDGGQIDDRVAVLEFELRQAHDTIKSLRMSLTGTLNEDSFLKMEMSGENLDDAEKKQDGKAQENAGCNPLIKRAMNYLVNEYLLQNGYNLSSITLAEEIDDQDFEDWDDVGLNMSKPPNLLKLFQEYSTQNVHHEDACAQTDDCVMEMERLLAEYRNDMERLKCENEELSCTIANLNKELEDAKGISILSLLQEAKLEDSGQDLSNSRHLSQNSAEGTVFPAMWNDLYSFWDGENTWLFKETSKVASNTDELVSSLTNLLPKIIFSINFENRDKLIPILLSTAAMQKDSGLRNTLMHNLFNLIERPDKQQRQIILSGCVAYAKIVGRMQAEEDVLPQFWEQIGHKYSERRLLVAEACGAIAPLLRPDMRSSLLLSILQQMEQEESNEKVRIGIVKSLAIVISMLEDDEKYSQLFKLCRALANDHDWSVHQATCSYLLPVFGCWSRQIGKFCDNLFDEFLGNLETVGNAVEKNSDQRDKASNPAFLMAVENLHSLLPSLLCTILLSMPEIADRPEELGEEFVPLVEFQDETHRIYWILQSKEQYLQLYNLFVYHISRSNANSSAPLSSCLYNFIPRLLDLVKKIDVGNHEYVNVMCELFSSFVRLFGIEFGKNFLTKHQFHLSLSNGAMDLEKNTLPADTALTTSLLPIYSSGVLATMHCPEASNELSTFLTDSLVALSKSYSSLESLEAAMIELRKKGNIFCEMVLNVLLNCMKDTSKYVRSACGNLFQVLAVHEVSSKMLCTDVLPALLTLSVDIEDIVQISTLQAFSNLLQCPDIGDDILDKIICQFGSFLAPADMSVSHHAMNVGMVEVMSEVTPRADPKFCNEFVLPHLAAIAARNNQETNRTKRSDMALEMLKAFTNISFCYIPDSLLQNAFLPGLRCLLRDMEKIHPEHVSRVEKLVKEMENKLDQRMGNPSSESNIMPSSTKPKFYNKFF